MAIIPSFRLYASNGTSLLYTFPAVSYTNAPQTSIKNTKISGIRGIGSITISGSQSEWELILKGVLIGTDYEDVTSKIDALESALALDTSYVLKFDKTPSTVYSYHVKRVDIIEYQENLRNFSQEYTIKLLANSW